MKAVLLATQSIQLGLQDVVVAGGMESMSKVPFYLPNSRYGMRLGHGTILDGVIKDGLWDPYNDIHMGSISEMTAKSMGFTRADQDAYAISSYERAQAAVKAGYLAREIVTVPPPAGSKNGESISLDEEPGKVKFDKIPTLKPSFDQKNGTITAANASKLNDGAAALVLTSLEKAKELGLTPLAKIRSYADAEQGPTEYATTPTIATNLALKRAGVTLNDCSAHEINEAFSVVVLANMRLLNLDHADVNVHGGAVALGHPIGASGARIIGSLMNVLQTRGKALGTASICNGGGGASAIVIEQLS
jgi:acetyl-CoA C-acetyltransferase